MKSYDAIVIGAGQAGLAAGYYLKNKGLSFVLLDRGNEVGEVWKNRYDSLFLFTPRFYSSLPGLPIEGEPNGYATKNEVASYLKIYAKHFELPIHFNTEVLSLTKLASGFLIKTIQGEYQAKNVIVATGPFQKPFIPQIADSAADDIVQIHTTHYQNSAQLQAGSVLVVGAGNSGAQIAVELAKDREVYLSVGHKIKFLPVQVMNKSIFYWFGKFRIYQASVHSKFGGWLSKQPDPIFGLELKEMLHKGVVQLKPRTTQIKTDVIEFSDRTMLKVKNIVWATGYHSDYSWLQIPNVLNEKGKPIHQRGISPVSGLYYVGLPWQYSRGSALIAGVGRDVDYVTNNLLARSHGKEREF
jgi:putative flavoprotein involved in K+ transport